MERECVVLAALFSPISPAYVDSQALDFLIQGGERNQESFRGFGLVPSAAFQHVDDDAAFDLVHDLEQARFRVIRGGARSGLTRKRGQEFRHLQTDAADDFLAADGVWEQIHIDAFLDGKQEQGHIWPDQSVDRNKSECLDVLSAQLHPKLG